MPTNSISEQDTNDKGLNFGSGIAGASRTVLMYVFLLIVSWCFYLRHDSRHRESFQILDVPSGIFMYTIVHYG